MVAFCAEGVQLDGVSGYHIDALTGTDSPVVSWSVWFYDDAYYVPGSSQNFWSVDYNNHDIPNAILTGDTSQRALNTFLSAGTVGMGGTTLYFGTNGSVTPPPAFLTTGAWHHALLCGDLNTGQCDVIIDGATKLNTPSYNVRTLFNNLFNGLSMDIFQSGDVPPVAHFGFHGRAAELWIAPGVNLLSGGVIPPATIAKFYNAGCPVDLGADGSTPTGSQPMVYLSRRHGDAASAFGTNRGSGGAFSIVGTPTAVDGPCACVTATQRVQGHIF